MDTRVIDLPAHLAMLPLFSDLDTPELARLAAGTRLRRLSRGDMVFRMGEPCEHFHVVLSGQVKLFAISPAGQEKVIELVGPGSSFAEALMFMDRPYFINAQALADAVLLSVGKAAVLAEIQADSRFAMRMLAGMSRRLHGLVRDVQAYALDSGVQRIIGYLLRDHADDSSEAAQAIVVTLPVSKATLASRLSITPEYFSRVLRELEDAGLLAVDKREIRILDAQRLARYPQA